MRATDTDNGMRRMIEADLELLLEAADEAAGIAMSYFRKAPSVWYKGNNHSPVSEADIAVDGYLRKFLLSARPGYGWLSEETEDAHGRLSCSDVFVVDPIDGTRAFVGGAVDWCVSIAVVRNGQPVAGVLAAPARAEVWQAAAGGGARINGSPIPPGPPVRSGSPLRVSMPDSVVKDINAGSAARIVRTPGGPSLALRLARLAKGELDGVFVRPRSNEWDIAAAAVLLQETGHGIVDVSGRGLVYNQIDPSRGMLVAGAQGELAYLRGRLPAA